MLLVSGSISEARDGTGDQPVPEGLGRLITEDGGIVGAYLSDGEAFVIVVGPSVDQVVLAEKVADLAGETRIEWRSCAVDRTDLDDVQHEITTRWWVDSSEPVAFGIGVDAKTCSVRIVSSQLTDAQVALLTDRYGDNVTFDRSATPTRD